MSTHGQNLSPAEYRVWALISTGLADKEIAREIGISTGTVKIQTGKLYKKLGVRNRTRAAIAFLEQRDTSGQHPDETAVDTFAEAMKTKLAQARKKGRGGWEDKTQCTPQILSRMLLDHVMKGDPVDVANFCMMLHMRGESISYMEAI